MNSFLRKTLLSIKRNPVINAFLLAVLVQVLQDWRANNIDFAHIFGYLATVCIAVATRMFVVPFREHENTLVNLHATIDQLRRGEKA